MVQTNPTTRPGLRWLHWLSCVVLLFFAVPSWASTAQVEIIHSRDRYPAGGTYPLAFRIRLSSSWYIHGTGGSGDQLVPTSLSFSTSSWVKLKDVRFPQPEKKRFPFSEDPIEVFSDEFLVRANLVVDPKAAPGSETITGRLSYQACSSSACLPPEQVRFQLTCSVAPAGTQTSLRNQDLFQSPLSPKDPLASATGWKAGAGLLLTLVGIFIGGLALNLTPCVYPLIPITVSYFGGRHQETQGPAFAHGILYILGLAVTNSLLGLTASLTGGMLGSALQNPAVILAVAGIILAMGLSFFGIWELRLPAGLTRMATKSFGGYFGTFFMGLTLGIVAAPCIGPFILGLLTYVGQKGDPFTGFLYFFVLSVGLGLPLSVLGVFSGVIQRLPLSGEWMVWVRKALGWVLMGMCGYLVRPLIPWPLAKSLLLAAVLFAAGLHLGWLEKSRSTWRAFSFVKKGLGMALMGGAITFSVYAMWERPGVQWIPYEKAVLERAAAQKRPAIVDFFAEWCGPCKAMDRTVFKDPAVASMSSKFVTVRVDLTRRHPHQQELQERYGVRGVPTIIFITPEGQEERSLRIESYVGPKEVLSRMKKILRKTE